MSIIDGNLDINMMWRFTPTYFVDGYDLTSKNLFQNFDNNKSRHAKDLKKTRSGKTLNFNQVGIYINRRELYCEASLNAH